MEKHNAWLNDSEPFYDIIPKQLVLENLDSTLAVFMFSKMTFDIYVSRALAKALHNNGITGLDIKPTNRLLKN